MFFVKDFIGTASLCAFLLIHLRFCKIAGSSLAALYNKVTADILCNMFNFHVESLTKNIIRRLSKKGEGGQHGVFSLSHTGCFVLDPALTSTGSNKREGGKEGSSSWTQQSMSPLLVNFIHVSHCCCFTRPPSFICLHLSSLLWRCRSEEPEVSLCWRCARVQQANVVFRHQQAIQRSSLQNIKKFVCRLDQRLHFFKIWVWHIPL